MPITGFFFYSTIFGSQFVPSSHSTINASFYSTKIKMWHKVIPQIIPHFLFHNLCHKRFIGCIISMNTKKFIDYYITIIQIRFIFYHISVDIFDSLNYLLFNIIIDIKTILFNNSFANNHKNIPCLFYTLPEYHKMLFQPIHLQPFSFLRQSFQI